MHTYARTILHLEILAGDSTVCVRFLSPTVLTLLLIAAKMASKGITVYGTAENFATDMRKVINDDEFRYINTCVMCME